MEVLILIALLGIAWLISPRRWKRRVVTPAAIMLLTYLALTSPWGIALANQGLVGLLPSDSRDSADAIVVLGRGEKLQSQRVERAIALWQEKRSPKIFVSGMMDAPAIVQRLKARGIPGQVLSGEGCSQNTEENAQFTSAILRPQGIQKILLITDPPHMLRSFLMFRSFGFTVIPSLSPLPPPSSAHDRVLMILREYVGLAEYMLTGRFKQRTETELNYPPKQVSEKFTAWQCRTQNT